MRGAIQNMKNPHMNAEGTMSTLQFRKMRRLSKYGKGKHADGHKPSPFKTRKRKSR